MSLQILCMVTSVVLIFMVARNETAPVHENKRTDTIQVHHNKKFNIGTKLRFNNNDNSFFFNTNGHYNSSKVKIEWGCDLCKIIIGLIQKYAEQNKTESEIEEAVRKACISLKVEDAVVCDGVVKVYKNEVLTVVNRLVLSPTKICSFTFGNECAVAYDPDAMWYVEFPPKPKPPINPIKPPQPGLPVTRVLHLTDIHIDMMYRKGYEIYCGEPICCRKNYSQQVKHPAPEWGTYAGCDLPWVTLENLFINLSKAEKYDYILMTGDIPAHYVWLSSKADIEFLMNFLVKLFLKYFPGVPVYFTLGNHEAVPVNSFPPDLSIVPRTEREDWLYRLSAETWRHWLPPDTQTTIKRGGFYTTLIKPGFRIISMNMNYCMDKNWWLLLDSTDPNGHLKWLIDVLQQAEDNKEKVHIIGHSPPGNSDCVKPWSWNYYNIINRYESTIVAQFYGHTHFDMFQMFYDPSSNFTRPTAVAYIGPSVVGGSSGNSGYRIYTVDGDYPNSTKMVLDHDNYILNLTDANAGNPPLWFKSYSAKDAFNLTSLLPKDWDALVKEMKTNDVLFNRYHSFHFKMHQPQGKCDHNCRLHFLCQLKTGRTKDPELCASLNIRSYQDFKTWQKSRELC